MISVRRPSLVRSAVVGLALIAGVGLAGCAEVQEAVGDRANQAACDAVEPLAAEVGNQVGVAAAEINVNPEGALSTIESLRTKVSTLAATTSGSLNEALTSVDGTLGELEAMAISVRDGGVITDDAITALTERITTTLQGAIGDC